MDKESFQHALVGSGGFLASLGLAQWSALASLLAACLTCVYMAIKIAEAVKKK